MEKQKSENGRSGHGRFHTTPRPDSGVDDDKTHTKSDEVNRSDDDLLDWMSHEVPLPTSTVNSLVGVKNAEQRVEKLARANANDEDVTKRKFQLEGMQASLKPKIELGRSDLERLKKTKDKTPRLERFACGRTDLPDGKKFSIGATGDSVLVAFWTLVFAIGCQAELALGAFNISRTEMEGVTGSLAWLMACLPFLGSFVAIKWLDPGDVDRNRHRFYKWLTYAAFLVTPIAMFIFAAKLDALLETDWSQTDANTGPSYTLVIWSMQISFAITIYLSSIKLGDSWYRFLGYEVRKTKEYREICRSIATCISELEAHLKIAGHVTGAIVAINARETKAIEDYRSYFDMCVKAAEKRQRFANAKAEAAAANARLEAENESGQDTRNS